MSLLSEFLTYLDADGLMGASSPPDPYWSGGNQLLETWSGAALLFLDNSLTVDLKKSIIASTRRCQVAHGLYNKNPPKPDGSIRTDNISHDDIIGVSMGDSITSDTPMLALEIVSYGNMSGWNFSNNGSVYFTAHAKPWHRAAYILACGLTPDRWSFATLVITCLLNAVTAYDDFSGKRLTWLILEATSRRNSTMSGVYKFWRFCVRKKYGSLTQIFKGYYKNETHPFCKYPILDRAYPANERLFGK